MNYYQHHIGDYMRDTAHLTAVEDGIYRRLIDWYYANESPLPLDTKKICRLIRARDKNEITAVQTIIDEFFDKQDDGYHQARCDREIADYNVKAETNRVNGKKGGRPKKQSASVSESEPNQNPQKTQSVISGLILETQTKGNQEPITINQEPLTNNQIKSLKALVENLEKTTFAELGYEALPDAWAASVLEDWPELHPDDLRAKWVKFRDHSLTHTFAITEPEWLGEFAKWLATDAPKLIEQRKNPPKAKPEPERKVLGIPISRIMEEAQAGESEHDCAARLNRKDQTPKTTKPHTPQVSMEWSRLECSMLSKLQEHDPELTKATVVEMAKTEGVQPVIVLQRLTTAAAKEPV